MSGAFDVDQHRFAAGSADVTTKVLRFERPASGCCWSLEKHDDTNNMRDGFPASFTFICLESRRLLMSV